MDEFVALIVIWFLTFLIVFGSLTYEENRSANHYNNDFGRFCSSQKGIAVIGHKDVCYSSTTGAVIMREG